MQLNTHYDIVLEMDYPLGESSDLAYDTWGRDVRAKLADLNCRVVRSRNHLKISVPTVYANNVHDLAWVISLVLGRIASQTPADVVIRIHELKPDEERAPAPQLTLEEAQ